MRITEKLGILLLAISLGATLGACSGDDASGDQENNQPDQSDAGDGAGEGDSGAADADDEDINGGDESDGRGEDAGQDDDARAPDAEDVADEDDTTPGEHEAEGCSFPPEEGLDCPPHAYGDHGPGSFIHKLEVKTTQEWRRLARDDGEEDPQGRSAIGDIAKGLEFVLGMPFDDVIASQIQGGRMVFLFEYAYFSDPVDDAQLDLRLFLGKDADNDFSDNMAGEGEFLIDSRSLNEDGSPISEFARASVFDGHLLAADGKALLLLPLDIQARVMAPVEVSKILIEADVNPQADLMAGGRVKLENGRLSGAVPVGEFYEAINRLADTCGCIESRPLYTRNDQGSWGCSEDFKVNQCETASDTVCQALGNRNQCQLIAEVINSNIDEGSVAQGNAALSLGAAFEATGASIVGISD